MFSGAKSRLCFFFVKNEAGAGMAHLEGNPNSFSRAICVVYRLNFFFSRLSTHFQPRSTARLPFKKVALQRTAHQATSTELALQQVCNRHRFVVLMGVPLRTDQTFSTFVFLLFRFTRHQKMIAIDTLLDLPCATTPKRCCVGA